MHQPGQSQLLFAGLLFSVCWALRTILIYAEPHVWKDPHVSPASPLPHQTRALLIICPVAQENFLLAIIFVGHLVFWIPVWLLPYDVADMRQYDTRCEEREFSWLSLVWMVVYIVNLVFAYATNDFARCYSEVGGFTVRRRAYLAWRWVRGFYLVWGAIGMVVLTLIASRLGFFSRATWSLLFDIIYAAANLYGGFLFVWLLSYALVEMPKQLWYAPQREVQRRYACFNAGRSAEQLDEATANWDDAVERLVRLGRRDGAREAFPAEFARLREVWRMTEASGTPR
jgi:magnesium-transporting ATPase (P-type)